MTDGGKNGERRVLVLSPGASLPHYSAVASMLFDTRDRNQCEALHELRAPL